MKWSMTNLRRAAQAERAAERSAEEAQATYRQTWWNASWLLGVCPQDEWTTARAEYMDLTGQVVSHVNSRRRVGHRFSEETLASFLPAGRLAIVAADALGRHATAEETAAMVDRMRQAETDGLSLREFSALLTGRSWTGAAENMTQAEQDHLVARVMRQRPEVPAAVLAAEPTTRADVTTSMRRQGHREALRSMGQEAVMESYAEDDDDARDRRRSHREGVAQRERLRETQEAVRLELGLGAVVNGLRDCHHHLDALPVLPEGQVASLADTGELIVSLASHLLARLRGESVLTEDDLNNLLNGGS